MRCCLDVGCAAEKLLLRFPISDKECKEGIGFDEMVEQVQDSEKIEVDLALEAI